MRFTLILVFLAATIMAVCALEPASLFDYARLPPCARECKVLLVSERNCLPPAAPASNNATYVDCLCHSEYLRELHKDGSKICHGLCAYEDFVVIHNHYNKLCGIAVPSTTATTSSSTSILISSTTLAGTLATFNLVHEPTTVATNSPEKPHSSPRNSSEWFRNNWKYFLIPASLIIFFAFLFIGLSCYNRYRQARTNNQDVESSQGNGRSIRLRSIHPTSSQSLNRSRNWSEQALIAAGFPSPTPSRPPPRCDPSFAATLRDYQNQIKEEDRLRAMRGRRSSTRAPRTLLETPRP